MKKETKKDIIIYLSIIILVVLIRSFIVTPVKVNGISMYPTLENNEIMLLNKFIYKVSKIKRFDIVVVNLDDDKLIKRVIAFPNETVEFKDNNLYINKTLVKENFKHAKTNDFSLEDIGLTTLPKDCYFVVGDNRNNSKDSRILGCVSKKDIIGKASITLFPFNKIGIKK